MNCDPAAVELFRKKAELVSTKTVEKPDMARAIAYALEICQAKAPFQPMMATGQNEPGERVVAAPALKEDDYLCLTQAARGMGVTVIKDGLRDRLAGIDLVLTYAGLGLAETATCILSCPNEDERLATMIGEIHVLALPKSRVVKDLYQAEDYMKNLLAEEAMYAAFISGSSRTSDIERVLTTGVHGPLELHVVLLDS